MKALTAATRRGWLPMLDYLNLEGNEFGEEGLEALADAIDTGRLESLKCLEMDRQHRENARLKAAWNAKCDRDPDPRLNAAGIQLGRWRDAP